jgi:hypothetical protein
LAIYNSLTQTLSRHACTFRDRIADRPPRPVIPAGELQALFDGPTPEVADDPVVVIDALNAAAEPGLTDLRGRASLAG